MDAMISSETRRSWRVRTSAGSCLVIRHRDLRKDETPIHPIFIRSELAAWVRDPFMRPVWMDLYEAAFGARPPKPRWKDTLWFLDRIDEAFRLKRLVLIRPFQPVIHSSSRVEEPKKEVEEAPVKSSPPPKKSELTWFRAKLRDEEGQPMAGEDYVLDASDGTRRRGKLDENGEVYIPEILPPGQCTISFPNIHLNPRKRK